MTEKEVTEGKAAFDRVKPALTVREILAKAAEIHGEGGEATEAQLGDCGEEPPAIP